MSGKRSVILAGLVIGVMLLFGASALAESLWWTAATKNVDASYTFTAAEMATMTYYVRVDKPNPRDNTSTSGWYYLGETRDGKLSFPADNSLASLMRSYGFGGQTIQFTVSQAFKGADGVERDSERSVPLAWLVPVPFTPRVPAAPPAPTIR